MPVEQVSHMPIANRQRVRAEAQKRASLESIVLLHDERIRKLEEVAEDVGRLVAVAETTLSYARKAVPLIVTALVASGIASGKFGAFLAALVQ